jgi:hypothetical protein
VPLPQKSLSLPENGFKGLLESATMTRTDVQKLYRVAGGRWWDPFRAQWEFFWARNAVRDLDSLLRRYVAPALKMKNRSP